MIIFWLSKFVAEIIIYIAVTLVVCVLGWLISKGY